VYDVHGHNFLRTMLRVGAERDELRVVDDQVGTPTPHGCSPTSPRRCCAHRIAATACGTWPRPVRRAGTDSRRDLRRRGCTRLLAKAPRVVPIPTSDYPTPAARPRISVLDTTKLQHDFGIALPQWASALENTLDRMHN
jgi:dTDP-4-dehydrorhamnose reductase